MALVLLVALDIWVGKALRGVPLFVPDLSDLIIFGALPMASVLSIGLYPILRSRHEHEREPPGLVGFEVGGLAALLLFLVCSLTMPHSLHDGVGLVLRAIVPVPPGPVFLTAAVILLLLPQLALALLGGWLYRRYDIRVKIIIERRTIPSPEPGLPPERLVAEGM